MVGLFLCYRRQVLSRSNRFAGALGSPGRTASLREDCRPFFAFTTVHRTLVIACGNRLRTPGRRFRVRIGVHEH